MEAEEMFHVSAEIPKRDDMELRLLAAKHGQSRSDEIRAAISFYLAQQHKLDGKSDEQN